jgi:hypothetical protein
MARLATGDAKTGLYDKVAKGLPDRKMRRRPATPQYVMQHGV